ncbi:hypothetical protein [Planktothricoides sp. SR001]|uniref:hypothetical protein n=1 Tax=Planktothricoides sp. SR001 TaxID=1705388 RepID=UPI000A9E83CF|nr:hypothetical protein [Planktothricoides sp. SR001]
MAIFRSSPPPWKSYIIEAIAISPINRLNLQLDPTTESYLVDILAKEKTTTDELLKRLLYQHWLSLQPRKTLVERRGGHPQHLLEDAPADLSLRENRKRVVAEYIAKRHYPKPIGKSAEITHI